MPTLMAVHAHPDDEGIQTGGVLAMYRERGCDTVLVTCTNGDMGDSPDGLKPESEGHDSEATVAMRLRELRQACEELRVGHLELLGYRDSGMEGWPQNSDPRCFWQTPLDVAAGRVAELMEKHRPEVVITYDSDGLYGHPDHIQAHRATMAAAERTGIPQKVYEIAFPRSAIRAFEEMRRAALAAQGKTPEEIEAEIRGDAGEASQTPAAGGEERPQRVFGTPDEEITTRIDVSSVWERKRAAIVAHQSQMANFDFLKMPEELLRGVFGGVESFVRRYDTTGAPVPETDLFAGISQL